LYELTASRVFGLARAITRDPPSAEEVVCDVYCQAWQRASRYDPTRASVLSWLLMMCRTRALDYCRCNRVRSKYLTDWQDNLECWVESGPEERFEFLQQTSALYRALGSLSPRHRRLLALAFFRGLSHQEIARATGLPLGTVKAQIQRSLQSLRKALHPL
ncbi:MAG: RNA polymerase sigma factor, partial [Steroidobacteraceae bacterium]